MSVSSSSPPDILSAEHAADPYATYRVLREHHHVCFHEPTSSWLVSRYEDLRGVFKDPGISTENYEWQLEPVHGRTIMQMEGREHTAHRSLLNPFFHGNGLESFRSTVIENARMLADPFIEREARAVAAGERERGEVDLVAEFTLHFPINVIEDMLAIPKQDTSKFEEWYVSIMKFLGNLSGDEEVTKSGLRTKQELDEYFLPVIGERRDGHGDDLISRFCKAEIGGTRLSDSEIRAFISLMLTAGGETTDRALASLFKNLIENPDQLRAVYEDRSLIADAFAETLRFSPPVHMIMRQTIGEVEIGGVEIPAKSTITCLIASGNRDPEKFADPDRFDIWRQDNSTEKAFSGAADHLAFAAGRHYCVGAMLAAQEVEVGASHLLDHMADLRFNDGFTPVETGIYTRAPERLEVSFSPVV
ncbi:MAG: cytochrome P450 [Solirubrobacteraceae bacterium]